MRKIRLLIIGIFITIIFGCNSNIDSRELIGMTKDEVLLFVFKNCPKNKNGELNIGTWTIDKTGKKSYQNHYYKSYGEAKKDSCLMNSNIWEIDKRNKLSFSILQKVECLELTFAVGKVIHIEKKNWYKT